MVIDLDNTVPRTSHHISIPVGQRRRLVSLLVFVVALIPPSLVCVCLNSLPSNYATNSKNNKREKSRKKFVSRIVFLDPVSVSFLLEEGPHL